MVQLLMLQAGYYGPSNGFFYGMSSGTTGAWFLIILIGIVGWIVQARLQSVFAKYSNVSFPGGLSGAEVAEKMLRDNGIHNVKITHVQGHLTDHFNPQTMTVNLSDSVYRSRSVAAAAVAAHECGHAIQHAQGYAPLELRSQLVPIVNFSSRAATFVLIFGMILLLIGFLTFLVYIVMDRRLDAEREQEGLADDEKFRFRDIFSIFRIRAFWYIALLCLLFYAAVHPFVKFAVDLVIQKFGVRGELSGLIPSLLPVGTLILTPLFGSIYDRRGKGASMMIWGALMLVVVYAGFSMPWITHWLAAVVLVIILGVAFSLVPSAMWPSVPKIIPEHELGTAYALIFWVQNWGLAGVPLLIGWALDKWGTLPPEVVDGVVTPRYDYTVPMLIFLVLGLLAVMFGLLLKREDKRKGYGLQKPNIVK